MEPVNIVVRYSMEAAADRALLAGAISYQSVKSILKNNLDMQPLAERDESRTSPDHENLRGPEYFK